MGLTDYGSLEELSPCPNCGAGPEQIELVDRPFQPMGFPAREDERELFYKCSSCGFETAPGISGYNPLSGRTTSTDHARTVALRRWKGQETRAAIRKRIFKDYPRQDWEENEKERAALIREGRLKPWD